MSSESSAHGDLHLGDTSRRTFTGTRVDGSRVEVHGCDVFTFRDGRIALKHSYRKHRPPIGPADGKT